MNWYIKVLRHYADFSGRARRSEYWYFSLINTLISFVLGLLAGFFGAMYPNSGVMLGTSTLILLYSLAILIPSIAVGVRRLHDISRTGWWVLIGLVPFIGIIVLIIFFVTDSTPGSNQYGPNPKGIS